MDWLPALDLLVLGDAALLLGALGALAAGAVRDSLVTEVAEGDETADSSIDAIAASLDPAVAISADVVGTVPKERNSRGASTAGEWAAVATGVGATSTSETDVDWEGNVKVFDEPPETTDCEAPNSLDLTAYRTKATPTPAPRSMVRICSYAIFSYLTKIGPDASFAPVSKGFHNDIKKRAPIARAAQFFRTRASKFLYRTRSKCAFTS